MLDEIIALASISSHSLDLQGLKRAEGHLLSLFNALEAESEILKLSTWNHLNRDGVFVDVPLGNAIQWTKRREAPFQLLLMGHYDTVYPELFPIKQEGDHLHGPGVADMKGGIVLLYNLLKWLESTPFKEKFGWTVLLNPDEEIGSPGSRPFIEEAAKQKDLALLFEPSLPNGAIVGPRPGSMTYVIEAFGRGGHAGRGAKEGRNALVALSEVAVALGTLQDLERGIIVNPAWMKGGTAANLIPDKATLLVNIRTSGEKVSIEEIVSSIGKSREVAFKIHSEGTGRPPRAPLPATLSYIQKLGLPAEPSFGVSDANLLEAYGLPTLDGLGPTGFHLHTKDESLLISSLSPRLEKLKAFISSL